MSKVPAVKASPPEPAVNASPPDQSKWKKGMAALVDVLMRSRLGSLAGVQYQGHRDIFAVAGYPKPETVKFEHYWGLYTRGDIAGRIVDMPAKTTWRTPPKIIEEEKADGTKFTKEFDALAKQLKLWSYFARLDRVSGIGEYGVMLIGVRGVSDTAMKTPLQSVRDPKDIIYLAVYNQANSPIDSWVNDPGDPRFGSPKTYRLRTNTSSTFQSKGGSSNLLVDASRVIHAAEDVLEDEVFGRPRMQRSLNRLFDLEKVAASTGEAYWQQVTQILQAKIDKDVEITPEQLKELNEQLGDIVHDLKRQFYGRGVDLNYLQTQTPNVSQVADFYFSLIAGSAGIPKRILFGSELGELASTQDEGNYIGLINERQEQFAEPTILRQFIDRMITIGALPEPETGEYQVQWPTLHEMSEKESAQVSLARAQTASALTSVGGNPRELVRITHEGVVELVERDPDENTDPLTLILGTPDLLNPELTVPDPHAPVDPNAPDPQADPHGPASPGDAPPPPKKG